MALLKKGTKLYSILKFKCPHCHEGKFFEDNNPYNLRKAGNLYEECPVCKRKYSIEPGFYYGAMYVAYAYGVALFVTLLVATYVLYPAADYLDYIIVIGTGLVLASPLLYALSKITWANMFMAHKGVDKTEKETQKENQRKERAQQLNMQNQEQ